MLQEINEFLSTFADLNSGYGVSNDYSFSEIGVCALHEIGGAVKRHLKLKENDIVNIVLLEHWEEQIFTENPLFPQDSDGEKRWFQIVPAHIALNGLSAKAYLVHWLNVFFGSDRLKVFRLQVNTEDYYACAYEEYVLYNENKSALYDLSFQVHD